MASVGIFSGSFNPIHIGHTTLAQYILAHTQLDEIWLVVSPCNPLKKKSELLAEEIRIQMVQLAINEQSGLHASNIEFALPQPSYTINTLDLLAEKYPQNNFSLIIGGDNWYKFDLWKSYETILTKYNVLVYPRTASLPDTDMQEPDWLQYSLYKADYHYQIINAPLLPISSTQIRQMLAQKKDAAQWLHPNVLEFILSNKLYGAC